MWCSSMAVVYIHAGHDQQVDSIILILRKRVELKDSISSSLHVYFCQHSTQPNYSYVGNYNRDKD